MRDVRQFKSFAAYIEYVMRLLQCLREMGNFLALRILLEAITVGQNEFIYQRMISILSGIKFCHAKIDIPGGMMGELVLPQA